MFAYQEQREAFDRVQKARTSRMPASPPGSRHGFYYQFCQACRKDTPHLTYIGGRCSVCQSKKLEGAGTCP